MLHGHDLYTQYVRALFPSTYLMPCSLGIAVRLGGGALIISVEKNLSEDNASMIKATYVLINLGIVPLLAAYDGFLSLMYNAPFPWFAMIEN
jgi:hypothetical protein